MTFKKGWDLTNILYEQLKSFCSMFEHSEEAILNTFKSSYFSVVPPPILHLTPADVMLVVDDPCKAFTGPFSPLGSHVHVESLISHLVSFCSYWVFAN